MYLDFFGLHERPFTITPDPRYLFMSERHAEALAHLIYGVTESDGFIVLTGEVGTGKTTLVRSLLQKMPEEADVALVLNPELTAIEFLTAIISELGITMPDDSQSTLALTEALNQYLLDAHSQGRRTIAVVDEAQNLSAEVLEQIRLLTNLETTRNKLLQIVLIGQPELRELLARNDLRQLAQRVTARYHLLPLNPGEAAEYLEHRLAVAGALRPILNKGAKKRIHQLASGIPRLMNLITDRALLGAWSRESTHVDRKLVDAAAIEVFGQQAGQIGSKVNWPFWLTSLAAAIMLVITSIIVWRQSGTRDESPVAEVIAPIERTSAPKTVPDVAPTTIAVAEVSALPSLDDWLAEHRNRTGNSEAFKTLFSLWQQPFNTGTRGACEQARAMELQCVAERSSLAELLMLDKPAIITLRDERGEAHQVVLKSALSQSLTLVAGDAELTIDAGALSRFWFGEYLLLWRPPNNELQSLRRGMQGVGVLWLRQSLTAITGDIISPADSALFDATLEAAVRAYQRSRRLKIDGLAGQRTQMMINADLGLKDVPSLKRTASTMMAMPTETM
ncbi:MAG: AAA family ATPase [Woeseiaceae bacterium]